MANSGDWDSLDPADTYYAYSWNFVRLLRPLADDVQVGARRGGRHARAGPRGEPGHAERRLHAVDLHAAPGREVRGRHAGHQQGRQVRRRAVAGQDDVPQRPHVLQRLPRPAGLHQPVPGHEPGQAGPDRDRDPRRPDDRVQAGQAVQRVRLLRPAPGDDPGAAGQGHRHEVQGARGLHRARTCSRPTTWARASRWSATRTGTRPPTPTASRCRTGSRSRSTSTPTTSTTGCSPATSTSQIEGSGVRPGGPGPDPRRPEPQGEHGQRRCSPAAGSPTSTARSRRWTTSTAARPCSTPTTATGYQRAYGGATGGDIATNLMPPVIPGAEQFDLYPSSRATPATSTRPRTS